MLTGLIGTNLALADDLIRVSSLAERATALLDAQGYVILPFVLVIILSLVKHLAKEETKPEAEQRVVSICIKNFCTALSLELKKKFHILSIRRKVRCSGFGVTDLFSNTAKIGNFSGTSRCNM